MKHCSKLFPNIMVSFSCNCWAGNLGGPRGSAGPGRASSTHFQPIASNEQLNYKMRTEQALLNWLSTEPVAGAKLLFGIL